MLQDSIHPAKPPFFIVFRNLNDFYLHKLLQARHTFLISSFALFLFRKYSPILFRAQINEIKILQASIPVLGTSVFRLFRDFNDFHLHWATVGESHLPYWFFLLCFCPENTACRFSEPILRRSKCYKALIILPKPRFSSFFAILKIYTSIKCGTPT